MRHITLSPNFVSLSLSHSQNNRSIPIPANPCIMPYKILNEEDNTEEKLRQGITPEEADNIIALTQALYFSDNANQVCDIDLVENIKDYSKEDDITLVNDSTYTVSEKVADELEQSDVFIIDSENGTGGQVALKVVSKKDNGDGTYTIVTEIPDAEDVIESVDIEGTLKA